MANKIEEKKNQETEGQQQEQTPKKESFLKRTWKRFGRDLLDIGIGVGIGAVAVVSVFKARSEKASNEDATDTDQETEEEGEDSLEVSDE